MPTKSEAMRWLSRSLEVLPELTGLHSRAPGFLKWSRNIELAIIYAFGDDSRHIREFLDVRYVNSVSYISAQDGSVREAGYQPGLGRARALLESMLEEVEEYWPDDDSPQPVPETREMAQQLVSNRVFVVHGRDGGTKDTVARFLESLDLEAVILHEQPNEGRTIVEKFEDFSDVGFAVILCTPDDVGGLATDRENLRPRPRQNVVLELGFFLAKLGRNRVCALVIGELEMPSDYDGVAYVPFDPSGGWQLTLARELRNAGLAINTDRLFGG